MHPIASSTCLSPRACRTAALLLLALVMTACTSSPRAPGASATSANRTGNATTAGGASTAPRAAAVPMPVVGAARVMDYVIGPADVLSISVWGREDLNRTVTVRPDGRISFELVGEIAAVGLTPLQLQQVMETALAKYINIIPGEVVVVVDNVESYRVSVLGEVREPGRFRFQSQVSVLEALAEAGGLTEFADSRDIRILRPGGGGTQVIRFDYARSRNGTAAELIYPGDIILVP